LWGLNTTENLTETTGMSQSLDESVRESCGT